MKRYNINLPLKVLKLKFPVKIKDEKINSDIFNENTMDFLLQDKLKEEMINVKMSHNLKESILESTIKKPKSLHEKFLKILNSTLEIPVSYACIACFIIITCSTLSTFIVTDNMKMDKELQGYTNIRVLNISGSNVILPRDISEVTDNEKN
jgi:hypothetical protein